MSDRRRAEAGVRELLEGLSLDADPEAARTPERVAGFLAEWAPPAAPPELSTFPVQTTGLVVARDLPFHSMCVHHLLPFFGHATIAYLPGDQVAGLGGLARLLRHTARQLQLQERLTEQLATALHEALQPRGVAVRTRARQLCVEMRGAESPGTFECTAVRLAHPDDDALRLELLAALGSGA